MCITTVAAKGCAFLPLLHFKYYVIIEKVCITTGGPWLLVERFRDNDTISKVACSFVHLVED